MDEVNETLWRSIDSNQSGLTDSFSGDTSFKSVIRCSDSSDEMISSMLATPQKNDANIEDGLLDALRTLQIASCKKSAPIRLVASSDDNNVSFAESENEKASHFIMIHGFDTNLPPTNVQEQNKNDAQCCGPDVKIDLTLLKSPHTGCESTSEIDPSVIENMTKAIKPLLKASATKKKVTKGVSPMLQTVKRSMARKTLSSNHSSLTINKINKNNNNTLNSTHEKESRRSSSLKVQATKNVVATVVSTRDGIKLREEKIKNFGIPVDIDRKKKRTQPMPFNLTSRNDKKKLVKLPMTDTSLRDNQALKKNHMQPSKLATSKELPTNKHDTCRNKENNLTNINKPNVSTRRPMPRIGGILADRSRINEKVKLRQGEATTITNQPSLKKLENEKMPNKLNQVKTASMPKFKIPLPAKSTKPLTQPKGPSFLSRTKKL
uniref:Uncharacterized protein n=1 Tax=Bracon brevicornis TaxID=1563983 RepID=A0A6V7LNA8_9HYME